MRILFIHNRYQQEGGEEAAVELQAELLKQNRHAVEVLYFQNLPVSGVLEKLRAGKNAIFNSYSEKLVLDKINEFQPDVVHVHNFYFNASPSIFNACYKLNIPVVFTVHNYRLICANAFLMRNGKPCELCTQKNFALAGIRYKCYHNSMAETAIVTAISGYHKYSGTWKNKIGSYILLTEFAKRKFLHSSVSVSNDKLYVIPNFVPDAGTSDFKRKNNYLFVGRLSSEKGINFLVKAFSQMPSKELFIIGDGPEKATLTETYKDFPNIRFFGKLNRPDLLLQLKQCKALIFPSLWYEGLPFTILEAFSTGTPVIASRLGAMEELIDDGINGFHFNAGNAEDLAQSIFKMEVASKDEDIYENARNTYLDKYTPGIYYKKIMLVYDNLVTENRFSNAG